MEDKSKIADGGASPLRSSLNKFIVLLVLHIIVVDGLYNSNNVLLLFRNSISLSNCIRNFRLRVYLSHRVLELLSGSPPILPQRSASLLLHLLCSTHGSLSSPATVPASSSDSSPRSTARPPSSSASTTSSATC